MENCHGKNSWGEQQQECPDCFVSFAKISFARDIATIYFQAFVSTSGYRIRSEPLVKRGLSDPDDPRLVFLKIKHLWF